MSKRNTSIIVAGLALGSLLLAALPAGAQMVYAPYMDQRGGYQQQPAAGWGGNNYYGWSGHNNSTWDGTTGDPRIDRREAYQQQQIHRGIDSGALTPGEARYLEREQGRIDRAEDRMLSDGNLSPRERQRLNQMQNRASRDIYRLEHNNRTTAGYEGWRDHNRDWNGREYGWQGHDRDGDRRDRGWQGHDRDRDRREYGWQQGHDRDRDHREYGWQQGHDRDRDHRDYGWHGNNPVGLANGHNQGWQGNGNSGWHGNNPVGNGYPGRTTSGGTTTAGYNQGQGHNGYGWRGNNTTGSGTTTGGTTTGGTTTTTGYNQGQGHSGYGWRGNNTTGSGTTTGGTTTGGTTTAGNTQGWQRNSARYGQPGAYQQPGAQAGARPGPWQGQQQYQRPSFQGTQPQMRPGQQAPWQGQQYQQARMQAPQPQMRPNFNMAPRQPSYGGMVNRANFSVPRRR